MTKSIIFVNHKPYILYRVVPTWNDVLRIRDQHRRARYFWLRTGNGWYALYLDRVYT